MAHTAVCNHPEVEKAYALAQQFLNIVRERKVTELKGWLAACQNSNITELASFAAGLAREEAIIRAALELPYSNGVTEGHVNRLKMIKRQMYGRASFELLRQRVLAA